MFEHPAVTTRARRAPSSDCGARVRRTILSVALVGSITSTVGLGGTWPWSAVRAAFVFTAAAVAVAAARRRPRQRASCVWHVPFGVAGIVIGLGIGASHLAEGAPNPSSCAALGALVAGLVALVSAGCRHARNIGWIRRIAVVTAAGATAVLVVFPLTLAVAVSNVAHVRQGSRTPADIGLAYLDVALRAADGVALAAWYVPSTNGAAVVLAGGATAVRADELDHAAVLARHGYGVLLIDHRGLGASGGDAMLWGWYGDRDLAAAVDYLVSQPDVAGDRIGAVGMSMGAEEAIGAAAADDRLRAVVAEGASGRGPRDEGTATRGVGGLLARYVDWTATRAADVMTSARRPPTLVRSIRATATRHTLLIAAGTRPNEIAAAHAMRAAAPTSVQVWIAAGADHTRAYDTSPAQWEANVIAFLDDTLRARDAHVRSTEGTP